MDIKLSQAYKLLAQLEMAAKSKSLNMESIKEEMETASNEFIDDIKTFNDEVETLSRLVKNNKHQNTKAQLVHLRGYAMNISSIMNNLVDEIDTFFQGSDLYRNE